MKNIFLLTFLVLSLNSISQEIEGIWFGVLNIPGKEIPFGLEFKDGNGRIFIPELSNQSYKLDSFGVKDSDFEFQIKSMGLKYSGKIENDSIQGFWMQNGQVFPLLFTRNELKKKEIRRPQTPKPPFSYYTEEVTVKNEGANLSLSGTLTLPTKDGKKYPVLLLVSGSGPQNRDSEILGHKSFAVIADHLDKQGIGSFRYDERGRGKSTGNYRESDLDDFQSDISSVVNLLLERSEIKSLGILGHSEGGILAPRYASENKKKIDFVILMAAPGIPIMEMMPLQRKITLSGSGKSEKEIAKNEEVMNQVNEIVLSKSGLEKTKLLTKMMTDYGLELGFNESQAEQFAKRQLFRLDGAWYKSFIQIKPGDYLGKVKCPTLVLQGEKDNQVPEKENIVGIKSSLKKQVFCGKDPVFVIFPNLNHLMQPCDSGNADEYAEIETTIDREVLFVISEWIKELK